MENMRIIENMEDMENMRIMDDTINATEEGLPQHFKENSNPKDS